MKIKSIAFIKVMLIYKHMTKKSIHLSIAVLVFCILGVSFTHNSSALTYSSNVDVGFTFNPTISVNLSGDLLINNLAPGSVSDSNTINVTVATNASQGYVLTATSGTKTTNTDLVNQSNSAYKFSSIATNASLANLTTDNTWGFSYSEDGTNWSNYSGLPLDNDDEGATGKQLFSTINPSDNKTIQFKIGAKASNAQAAGTYQNTINFYAVANPDPTLQPVSCPARKICYNSNSLTTVVGEMGQQSASNGSTLTLYASNFKRDGYGFAGWNDKYDYSGTNYGPNQGITAPADVETNGLSLYAIWVKSAGDMQNWTGCSNLAQGEVTALKDTRDNDVYAVAKLADGKCWMIENLRLADKDSSNNDINLSNTNTHNPSLPLTNSDSTTSNHLSPTTDPTTTAWCTADSSDCDDQSMLATNNTTLFTSNTTSNYSASSNVYSYGNYYNWYSATGGHGKYGSNYGQGYESPGDICPAGWHLPKGGNKSQESTNEFWQLIVTGLNGGTNPANYGSSTRPYYTGTAEAGPVSNALRSYPNNFVYSGNVYGSSVINRNSHGLYWSSSAFSSNYAYDLSFYSSSVSPGTSGSIKYYGWMARCVAGT